MHRIYFAKRSSFLQYSKRHKQMSLKDKILHFTSHNLFLDIKNIVFVVIILSLYCQILSYVIFLQKKIYLIVFQIGDVSPLKPAYVSKKYFHSSRHFPVFLIFKRWCHLLKFRKTAKSRFKSTGDEEMSAN